MIELAIKLTLAHLLGDFVFQSDKAVKSIRKQQFKSTYLYAHFVIHLLLIVTLTGFKTNYLIPAFVLAVVHIAIDCVIKFMFETDRNRIACFLIDQFLHVLTLAAFVNYFFPFKIQWGLVWNPETLLLLTSLVAVTFVSSILMKILLTPFSRKIVSNGNPYAGKLIGILERLFIFLFVVKGFWEGIGFLLAAKSIFRFGDLKESKDIKLTEYILIGTLLSFGLGIAVGEIYLFFRAILVPAITFF